MNDDFITFETIKKEAQSIQADAPAPLWAEAPRAGAEGTLSPQFEYEWNVQTALRKMWRGVKLGSPPAMSTGFVEVDGFLGGGYRAGELHILAARTAVGKTSYMLSQCLHLSQAHKVAYISLEMPEVLLCQRLAVQLCGVPISKMRWSVERPYDKPDDDERDEIKKAIAKIAKRKLLIIDQGADFNFICGQIRQLAQLGAKVVVIDGLWLMRGEGSQDLRIELKRMTGHLKELAIGCNIAIIGVHQINRGVESRQDKRPGVADLRDSSIEDDADTVTALYREVIYSREACPESERDSGEAIILKNRNGPTGTAHLKFFGPRMQWANR